MFHDGLSDPGEDKDCDLGCGERCWVTWCLVTLDVEKGSLLVAVVIKSQRHDWVGWGALDGHSLGDEFAD